MKTFFSLIILGIAGVAAWYYFSDYRLRNASPAVVINKTDTMIIIKDSIINAHTYDTMPVGFYQGMLPCKNCEGIQRTIVFTADYQYKMEELNWGKGTLAKMTSGTWEKEKGKFVLYRDAKAVSEYKLVKDSLINTKNNGIVVQDSLSAQNVLFKKNTAPENASWKKRKADGIDIIGNGNEPFWNIEIDREKLILFKHSVNEKPVIVPIEMPLMTRDSTVYSVRTESGDPLRIAILSKFCNDGVSDHVYEYQMNVLYKGRQYKGCAVILNPGNAE
ncbi:MAG: copper resistance protein NlpE N-terminal domain-containing protein [Chitinophagaceae bacterium]